MSLKINIKKFRNQPISFKILYAFLPVCCCLTVVSGIIYYTSAKKVVADSIKNQASLICNYAENEFNLRYSTPIEDTLRFLAVSPQLNNYLMSSKDELLLCHAEVEKLFLSLLQGRKSHLSTAFLDASGQEKIAVYGNKRKKTYRLLAEIAENDVLGQYIKKLFMDLKSDSTKTLAYSGPFYDAQKKLGVLVGVSKQEPEAGGFGGVIIQHYDLTDYIQEIGQNKILDTAVIWIYGSNWENFTSPPDGEVQLDPRPLLSNGKETSGSNIYIAKCKLFSRENPAMTIVCSIPKKVISKELASVVWSVLAIFSALLVASLASSFLISRLVTRPIKKLTKAVKNLSAEKFDVSLTKSGDEIGILANAFKETTTDLTTSISNLNREITERKELENAMIKQSEQRVRYQKALLEIGKIKSDDLHFIFKYITEKNAAALGVKRVSIWFYNNDRSAIVCEDLYVLGQNIHDKGLVIEVKDNPVYFRSIGESRIVASNDALTDPHTSEFAETYLKPMGITSMMDVFIRVNSEIIGVICHEHVGPAKQWTSQEQEFAASVSDLISLKMEALERKKAEEKQADLLKKVEKANKELREFAYVASHDLKAPLRGISTLASWIVSDYGDKLDEKGKEQFELLLGRVRRMQKLIDGILQYSRVGRVEEENIQVNLNELLPEIVDLLAPPENIEITIENELPVIECGQTRITQVFQNLLSNAIKYMDKPQGQIKVDCIEEDGFWKFSVADNGPGIEEEHFERIFQIFQTLSRHDENGGTGIGLTIIKKIVELYGGKIWVESKLGEGSTFFFSLPKQTVGVKNEELETNIVS